MDTKNHNLWLFILAVAGTLFSGYMSATKLFSQTCPFSEPCAYFLGVPACYFGFFMFAALLVLSGIQLFRNKNLLKAILGVSIAGILFSGYYSISELMKCSVAGSCSYSLGLPTCAYGLVFYIAVFAISLCAAKCEKKKIIAKKKPAAKKGKGKRK
jgi:uncharacterized membrane protein